MTQSTWRDKAKTAIQQVMAANPDASGEKLEKLLFDAYPFGQRRYHPYKVWLDEVKKAKKLPTPAAVRNFWID